MNTMIVIAMTLLFAYTLTVCVVNRGVPSSLSATVFALPPMGAWLWTLIIGTVAGLTMPVILEKAPDNWKFLGFLCIVGLIFVALCPLDRKKSDITYKLHVSGACLCAACSQLLLLFAKSWLLYTWIPWVIVAIVILARKYKWPSYLFWAEMTCFTNTFIYSLLQ